MKIRTGFVSNSSSSSFILEREIPYTREEVFNLVKTHVRHPEYYTWDIQDDWVSAFLDSATPLENNQDSLPEYPEDFVDECLEMRYVLENFFDVIPEEAMSDLPSMQAYFKTKTTPMNEKFFHTLQERVRETFDKVGDLKTLISNEFCNDASLLEEYGKDALESFIKLSKEEMALDESALYWHLLEISDYWTCRYEALEGFLKSSWEEVRDSLEHVREFDRKRRTHLFELKQKGLRQFEYEISGQGDGGGFQLPSKHDFDFDLKDYESPTNDTKSYVDIYTMDLNGKIDLTFLGSRQY